MATEEQSTGPSAVRQALAWLGYRVSGAVLLLLGLVLFFIGVIALIEPIEEVVKEIGEDATGVFRVMAVLLLLAGAYVLVVGVQLCRGKLTLFADLRSFIGGNSALAAVYLIFWDYLDEMLFFFPYATPTGMVLIAVGGLWLWTAAKLLRGNRAPVADLRMCVGGNAALVAALFIMLAGTSFIAEDDGVMQVAGGACIVAGIVVLLLAAKLLRVTAKRERVDEDGGPAAEERA